MRDEICRRRPTDYSTSRLASFQIGGVVIWVKSDHSLRNAIADDAAISEDIRAAGFT
jgi:hypothetical protein